MDITMDDDDHSRTIIHIDLDCFYAQVEMIKNPSLYDVPLGIQQKHIVVTSNYIAREFGVRKCVTVADALKTCPNLRLVNGEDLHEYRQVSYKVTNFLQKYSPSVERLGLDENFIDVSNLVQERLKTGTSKNIEGNVFGNTSEVCECGCYERLKMGTVIAKEMCDALRSELKLSSCAGIAHNKIVAKICGSRFKPNQQTVVFPLSVCELMCSLNSVTNIPGIGKIAGEQLKNLDIKTVEDLQNSSQDQLKKIFGSEKAKTIWDLSFGRDPTPVKVSGKPQSIGLEDSCRTLSVETEIYTKFQQLLTRLMVLVSEDGRVPRTIKLTVRKFDPVLKVAHKETKQCNLNSGLFQCNINKIQLPKESETKLMKTIMFLFSKIVDIKKPFRVSLLGLSFTKFQENSSKSSITSFFKNNMEVQAPTNIENKLSAELMDYADNKNSEINTDGSESELEPSPKKSKISSVLAKRHCVRYNSSEDIFSPSKLKVAELRLNSKDHDKPDFSSNGECSGISKNLSDNVPCPAGVDKAVFQELPPDVQKELWDDYIQRKNLAKTHIKKPKVNSILNYLVKNS